MGYLPALFRCVRGAPCEIPVQVAWRSSEDAMLEAAVGAGTVPSAGSMLVTGG